MTTKKELRENILEKLVNPETSKINLEALVDILADLDDRVACVEGDSARQAELDY